jgi:hypothetical protein
MNAVERLNKVRANIKRHIKACEEIKRLIIDLDASGAFDSQTVGLQSPDASAPQQKDLSPGS